MGDDNVDLDTHKLSGQLGQWLGASLRPTILNCDVSAISPTRVP